MMETSSKHDAIDREPYRDAGEHARDEMMLIGLLAGRAIRRGRDEGWLPASVAELAGQTVDEYENASRNLVRRIEARLAASRESGAPLPMDSLRRQLELGFGEQRVLWALVGHDLDPRVRLLLRSLGTESGRGVSVGALLALLYDGDRAGVGMTELGLTGRLVTSRLVECDEHANVPVCERRVWAAERTLELAHGVVRLDPSIQSFARYIEQPRPFGELLVAERLKTEIVDLARGAAERQETSAAIAVIGAEGSGRRSLVHGAAAATGRPVIEVECGGLPDGSSPAEAALRAVFRETRIFAAVLVLVGADRPGLAATLDRAGLSDLPEPVFAVMPQDEAPLRLARGCTTVEVPVPEEPDRRTLWRRALPALGTAEIDLLGARYPVTGGVVLSAGAAATARAEAHGRSPSVADVHEAVRGVIDTRLGGLGSRVTVVQEWDDLVLPEDAMAEVRELIARLRHRRQVLETWGFGRKLATGRGLSALFSGPPGTGKTMVAGLIARDLGLDLYRVDLSRIVSKWVGETEKNLASLFAAAEAGHAILLFDEADSLFAKRTEVKSSNDRYANLEVNYLLQRMEAFAGITILTTNHDAAIDDAFRRRLSFRIEFPVPDVAERELLWRSLIPADAALAADVDFDMLAEKYELSGGHIRNVVLRAAYRAADDGQPIGMDHLLRAAAAEVSSLGRVASHHGGRAQ